MVNKIEKQQHEVIIYTRIMKMEGSIHVSPGERISDFLSSKFDESFIPFTNVKISEIMQQFVSLKTENEALRNELVTLKAQGEVKNAEIEKLNELNAMKDLEIEEIVDKIESMMA